MPPHGLVGCAGPSRGGAGRGAARAWLRELAVGDSGARSSVCPRPDCRFFGDFASPVSSSSPTRGLCHPAARGEAPPTSRCARPLAAGGGSPLRARPEEWACCCMHSISDLVNGPYRRKSWACTQTVAGGAAPLRARQDEVAGAAPRLPGWSGPCRPHRRVRALLPAVPAQRGGARRLARLQSLPSRRYGSAVADRRRADDVGGRTRYRSARCRVLWRGQTAANVARPRLPSRHSNITVLVPVVGEDHGCGQFQVAFSHSPDPGAAGGQFACCSAAHRKPEAASQRPGPQRRPHRRCEVRRPCPWVTGLGAITMPEKCSKLRGAGRRSVAFSYLPLAVNAELPDG